MFKFVLDAYRLVSGMFTGQVTNKNKPASYMGEGRSHQRSRRGGGVDRTFKYCGVDGKIHSARIGKPFPVRPMRNNGMVLATKINRELLQVRV